MENENLLITQYNPLEVKKFLLEIGFNEVVDPLVSSERWHCVVIDTEKKNFTIMDANAFLKHVFVDRFYFSKYKGVQGIEELSNLLQVPEQPAEEQPVDVVVEETTDVVAQAPAPKKKRTSKKKANTETKVEND